MTSNILNPFLISALAISLIAAGETESPLDALRWSAIAIMLSTLPVLIVVLHLVRKGILSGIFINVRRERHRIYLLAGFCVLADAIVLYRLGAPPALIAACVAALTAAVVFALINLVWKISVHTAFVAALVTVLIIIFGAAFSVTAFLVPLIAWARMELDRHSLAQVVSGAVLAAAISFAVFYSSGLV